MVQNLIFKKCFFSFFEGIQFLAFLANSYKNLENGKTFSSFFKYWPNFFSQNFAVRKSVKRKFIPLINETPKLESDSEVVNLKRKTNPLLINETQEDDMFVIDEEYDIVIEK